MNSNKSLMIIILHVNDTVKLRISKLPYTLTTLRELIFARSNFPKIFFRKINSFSQSD